MLTETGNVSVERRKQKRRIFSSYMKVMENHTMKLMGHMADVNLSGFKLDSPRALPVGVDFHLRLDLGEELERRRHVSMMARSRWCRSDNADPFIQNVGFEIVSISDEDAKVYMRLIEKYSH